jgi:hypothetical protein
MLTHRRARADGTPSTAIHHRVVKRLKIQHIVHIVSKMTDAALDVMLTQLRAEVRKWERQWAIPLDRICCEQSLGAARQR